MSIQVVYLDSEDDIVSILDRLDWARERQVVLVLPDDSGLLTEFLDLARLRRHADSLRIEVGIVTLNSSVSSQAKALGFPVFRTVQSSQNQRRWWRGRLRRELVGRPIQLDERDRREVKRRRAQRPRWQRWALRYAAIVFYILTLTALFVTAVYAIPGATVTFKPETRPLRVRQEIVADPELENVDYGEASVPGRALTTVEVWQAEVATTGTIEVPDAPARGKVVFANRLEQPVTVPAGTRVSTSTGDRIVFQTLTPVQLPGVVGATAEADVIAIEPGPDSNVEANLVNRVQGSLSLQLEVRNLDAIEGGGVRVERAVTESDQERLRAQVLQQLQALALVEMEGMLSGQEFLARESLRVARPLQETFSHFPGEQSNRLALELQAELQATAVDEAQAVGLVYDELAGAVRPGFDLVPDSLEFSRGEVLGVDGQGRVTFEMIGEGEIAAQLHLADLLERIAGQDTAVATNYLYEKLPLSEEPTVRVWPEWFGRMPYLPIRIRTHIESSG